MSVTEFINRNYRHFNAATLRDAAEAYRRHIDQGGKMLVAMGGAMSTAELGVSLAEMIRQDKVHIISCTGANLEEDVFNLVAHEHYERVPEYRMLTAEDEVALRDRGMNRVTDTCIPEEEALRRLEKHVLKRWKAADEKGESYFPYEYMYQVIESGELEQYYQIDPKDSWIVAACEKKIPILSPGWEDSTLGNIFVARKLQGEISDFGVVKHGLAQMELLVNWYREMSRDTSVGFFQIAGGIAGDFPICAVPLMIQDLEDEGCKYWGYFCQISDSTTSYGSYSGAVPNEKIAWGKLDGATPRFIIESDATIVAPLMFSYVLGN